MPAAVCLRGGGGQVGVVHEYRASQGRVVLHLMNLSGGLVTDIVVNIAQVRASPRGESPGPAAVACCVVGHVIEPLMGCRRACKN